MEKLESSLRRMNSMGQEPTLILDMFGNNLLRVGGIFLVGMGN